MFPLQTGPAMLDLAHEVRRDDLRRAAEHRRARIARRPRAGTRLPPRPWWWGLARARQVASRVGATPRAAARG